MTHVACKSKVLSVVRSCMHPCPGIWVAIEQVVIYFARAACAFSAGITYLYCDLLVPDKLTLMLQVDSLGNVK